ncbi:MAG: hotdog fold thioesterase [Stellaceae bacterium]
MDGDDEAARILAAIAARNGVARELGIELETVRAGAATLALVVGERMLGGHGVCQGGYIFMLADMAGAYACLSRGSSCLTQTAHITYASPARLDERLVAAAEEMMRTRRSAIYDVRVTAAGRLIALFRGQWRILEAPAIAASP